MLPQIFDVIRKYTADGLAITGGFAHQHFLPPERHSLQQRQPDVDFLVAGFKGKEPLERLSPLITPQLFATSFRRLAKDQPHRSVFESLVRGEDFKETIYVHVEVTDIPVTVSRVPLHCKAAP